MDARRDGEDVTDSVVGRSRVGWRPLVLVALVVVFIAAQVGGVTGSVTDLDHLSGLLAGAGVWGFAAFVAGFALSHAVGFPSAVLVLLAGAVWPLPSAVAVSWVGAMAGTSLAYGVAAWAGRDWAMQRIPPRLRRVDRSLAERGPGLLLAVRVLLLTPAPADWICGVASVRYRQFAMVTALGLVPPTLVLTSSTSGGLGGWPLVAGLTLGAVALGVCGWLLRRRVP
jgi:uncharacterized membrane protein YdjX (TVP38/TMEM64 family)